MNTLIRQLPATFASLWLEFCIHTSTCHQTPRIGRYCRPPQAAACLLSFPDGTSFVVSRKAFSSAGQNGSALALFGKQTQQSRCCAAQYLVQETLPLDQHCCMPFRRPSRCICLSEATGASHIYTQPTAASMCHSHRALICIWACWKWHCILQSYHISEAYTSSSGLCGYGQLLHYRED